ncbi:magnesium chelatase/cobaltochelatase [Acididesulfobacillus acetoxydans]|uniref:Magnesium chelatase/cobaltochelatase n=1 Tax=Acididesulfobacillus acetoxydans TaxID=1561005 RepID=A0A8S0WA82_9FIRM|nr:cobaltochelatase subunit CobN [Acididesulfobacillus acetoxydans]CAA7603229.1 magnesium chelatase/cobaltochelatase [Acididesulfobacillus acetoxydans]
MGGIIFLTNMERQYAMLERVRRSLEREGRVPPGRVVFLSDSLTWGGEWEAAFLTSAFVIFNWMGSGLDTPFLKRAAEFMRTGKMRYTMLITEPDAEVRERGISARERKTLQEYLAYGGRDNYRNLWLWLNRTYGREGDDYRPPQPLLWNGIFHPHADKSFADGAQYRRLFCRTDRPTVGILFYRDEWVWGDLAYQSALVEEIERQGMNAVAVFSPGVPNPELRIPGLSEALSAYFYAEGVPAIDVLINTLKFSLTTTRALELKALERLNVPVLQAYTLFGSRGEWQKSREGLSATEIAVSVTMPEFDGIIHALPVAGREHLPDGSAEYLPIPERIQRLVRKAEKWARLRYKANGEKKIGIIFHNYPPTNSNIGSALGLDSPESIRLLLAEMLERGYRVDHIPADSRSFMNELVAHATNDRRYITDKQIKEADGKLSAEQYRKFFAALAEETQEQLRRDWGTPPGEVFHYDGNLLVPGMLNGNVFMTVQPPRGFGEDPAKIYHSPDSVPTHHYLAYYHWLRDIWQADAVIHVGTHGSLEWLPGKGAALSRQCYPDLALGDLPNIYPYWLTVVGEGIQAKRRAAACLISYLSPPMSQAGTYDELAELENLLDEYSYFQQNQPGSLETIMTLIREKAAAANLEDEVPADPEQPFSEYVQRLHVYLTDIKNMQIRVGLHVLGCPPQDESLIEYLLALTRPDNGDIPSLTQTLTTMYGFDYYELLEGSGQMLSDGSRTYGALIDEIRERSREVILLLSERDFALDQAEAVFELPWTAHMSSTLREQLLSIARYICHTIVPSLQKTRQEITNLLAALEGSYVEPGPAGAVTSGMADILPTGRNFYGVDPRTLPTPAAWEMGKTLSDELIARYIAEEGRYPENIGIVLFATDNLRSHGQCLAEFLCLLGVRPVWQRGSQRVVDLEAIPIEELKRPRLDVTARISGFFRDSLPMVFTWMDKAVKQVAHLDEGPEINYVRKHIRQEAEELEKQGMDNLAAWEQASYRIFSDPPGTYGAGIGAVLEAKNWETIADLGKVYVRWGGYAYGAQAKGVFVPELFSRRLAGLDVTIKNEDNREVHMLSSDDYNAYHGGMIAAVRSLKGEVPRSYCGDSSDRNKVVLRSLQEEMKRLFRGEAINPKFIEGMKEHGYKGAADLANYVAHSYQWDATSSVMEDWMYQKYAEKYALDEKMQEWMKEVNPWALQRIAETLLEAAQRGLWQTDEQTREELRELYLGIEGELEEESDAPS